MRGVVIISIDALESRLKAFVGWNLSGRKLHLRAMSIVHVEVGRVTESLPRNDAYALIFVYFGGHAGNFGPAAAAPAPTALPQLPVL